MPAGRGRSGLRWVHPHTRGKPPDDPVFEAIVDGESDDKSNTCSCARQLDLLMQKSFPDLQFLLDEFVKLESAVTLQGSRAPGPEVEAKLSRLRSFITHVQSLMERMWAARDGRSSWTRAHLDLVETHILESVLPVKERLVDQTFRASGPRSRLIRPNHGIAGGDSTPGVRHAREETGTGAVSPSTPPAVLSNATDIGDRIECDESDSSGASTGGGVGAGDGGSSGDMDVDGEQAVVGGGIGAAGDAGLNLDDEAGSAGAIDLVFPRGIRLEIVPQPRHPHDVRCRAAHRSSDALGAARPAEQPQPDRLNLMGQLNAAGVTAGDDSDSCHHVDLARDQLPASSSAEAGSTKDDDEVIRAAGRGTAGAAGTCRAPPRPLLLEEEPDPGPAPSEPPEPRTVRELHHDGYVSEELKKADVVCSRDSSCIMDSTRPPETSTKPVPQTGPPLGRAAVVASTETCVSNGPSSVGVQMVSGSRHSTSGERWRTNLTGAKGGGPSAPSGTAEAGGPGVADGAQAASTELELTGVDESRTGTVVPKGEGHQRAGLVEPRDPPSVVSVDPAPVHTSRTREAPSHAPAHEQEPGTGSPLPVAGAVGLGVAPWIPRPAKRRRSSVHPAAPTQPRGVSRQCGNCHLSHASTAAGNSSWLSARQGCPVCNKLQVPCVGTPNPNSTKVEGRMELLTEACAESASDSGGNCTELDEDTSEDSSEGDDSADEGEEEAASVGYPRGVEDGTSHWAGQRSEATLDSEQASKLLVLMCHAHKCPGQHRSPRLAEVCRSVKLLMEHVRSCDGRTRAGQPCPMPWCRPCASLTQRLGEYGGVASSYQGHPSTSGRDAVTAAPAAASAEAAALEKPQGVAESPDSNSP